MAVLGTTYVSCMKMDITNNDHPRDHQLTADMLHLQVGTQTNTENAQNSLLLKDMNIFRLALTIPPRPTS